MRHFHLPLSLAAVSLTLAAEAGAAASPEPHASAELYTNQTYTYGRFEARVRFAAGDGIISSFFMWKPGSEMPNVFWNELDFEKLGADCHLQTNPLYGLPVVDHGRTEQLDSDLCGEYHTYGFDWTPTYIAYSVDGVEVRRDGEEAATAFAENASSGMQIHFNVWPGDATFGGNFDPATLPVQQYISWVQYSSFADGAFTFQWREEFDGPTVPSGWAVGNWPSPKNRSTHQPANVTFSGGFAVLSLTAENATGFNGVPPEDAEDGSVSPPDSSAGAGGEGTSGGAGIPPGGENDGDTESGGQPGTGGAGNSGSPAPAGGASSSTPTGAAGASAAGTGVTPTGTPPRASNDSSCSHVAPPRGAWSGSGWLVFGAAIMAAFRRGRRRPEKGCAGPLR